MGQETHFVEDYVTIIISTGSFGAGEVVGILFGEVVRITTAVIIIGGAIDSLFGPNCR